jgi:hypothetical protein
MDKQTKMIVEELITRKAQAKADELGVIFKVKLKKVDYGHTFLVRIKNDSPNIGVFADYMGKLIVPEYSNDVQYTYPSKL